MRTKLTTIRLLASLVVPLMFACGSEGSVGEEFVTVPQCGDANQVLSTDQDGRLICKDLPAGAAALPNCKKYSEALTSDGTRPLCTNRNNESQATRDALNNLESSEKLINDYTTRLGKLTPGPGARAVYCGQTSGTTTGRILNGTAVGVAAAAQLCSQVAACGNSAKMCSVYDMYYSAATGVITQAQNITKSWVFMASWQNFSAGANEPTAGLNDNCGSYTYGTGDLAWRGTAVKWEARNNGEKVLKFITSNLAPEGTLCSATLPIACCK
jgi:hypothetical protein